MKILAPAKINLALDILKKTVSGYHEIQTVFHEIPELADEINLIGIREKDNTSIPNDLANQAQKLLKQTFNIKKHAKIIIHKKIPISSGLGGASSDAAAVLKGLNQLWGLNLTQNQLMELAAQLGADVPFFIIGKTALGTNFGEKITPLPHIKCVEFKINPQREWPNLPKKILQKNKTTQMYATLDLSKCGKNTQKTTQLIEAIKKQNPTLILQSLHNDFETLIKPPKNHHLSGSGPATFNTHFSR